MILVAYGCLVVALAWLLIRGDAFRLPKRYDVLARLVGVIGGAAMAGIALLVIATSHPTRLGRIVVLVLLLGSILYVCGSALWDEHAGIVLRLIGWTFAVVALAIPTTLTLLLPLVALLGLTLRPASEKQTTPSHPAR